MTFMSTWLGTIHAPKIERKKKVNTGRPITFAYTIRDALIALGGIATSAQLCRAVGRRSNSVGQALQVLESRGIVKRRQQDGQLFWEVE